MSDLLLELSRNPATRKLLSSLPIPQPQPLLRSSSPLQPLPLTEYRLAFHTSHLSNQYHNILRALRLTGATIHTTLDPDTLEDADSQSRDNPTQSNLLNAPTSLRSDFNLNALVFDATYFSSVADLDQLYNFFNPLLKALRTSSRVLILSCPPETAQSAAQSAARHALDGFVRSLSKELGKKGSTVLRLILPDTQPLHYSALVSPLSFFLSPRSAYITAQTLSLSPLPNTQLSHPTTRPLHGKTALVTGAARGIGASTARTLAREGAHVFLLDRPDALEPLQALADELSGTAIGIDITSVQAPQEIIDAVQQHAPHLDILVHNAGVTRDRTLKRMQYEAWKLTLNVNLHAVERVTTHLLEHDALSEDARIICLSSIAGIAGNAGQTNYSTAKSGVLGLVQHFAQQLSGSKRTINAIAPGFIETRMTAAMPAMIREVARRFNSLGQGGQPQDIAETVTFFALPNAQAIHGQALRVCGGSLVGA